MKEIHVIPVRPTSTTVRAQGSTASRPQGHYFKQKIGSEHTNILREIEMFFFYSYVNVYLFIDIFPMLKHDVPYVCIAK